MNNHDRMYCNGVHSGGHASAWQGLPVLVSGYALPSPGWPELTAAQTLLDVCTMMPPKLKNT